MVQGLKGGAAANAATESMNAVNTPINSGGASDGGGLVSREVDAKESSTAPKFGEIYKQIQSQFGAKPEKPREIKKTLGKDDFLRIMITQMKNQDPTSPFKAEQMATEIAQFTNVEQLQNVNQNLTKMANQNKPIENMAMTSLIGKTVTIDRERFPHVEGQAEALNFVLPKDAATVQVAILSETGEVMLEKEIGAQKAGTATFNWDGIKANTTSAKSGNYMFRIEAKNDRGQAIETNPQAQARVIGISFEGTDPVFLVGDAHHQDKVTMRNIVRIEMDNGQSLDGRTTAATTAPINKYSNFIEFQRGVGSNTAGGGPGGPAKPEIAKVLEKFQQAQGAAGGPPPSMAPSSNMQPMGSPSSNGRAEEKGFPSGLQDPEQQKPASAPNALEKGGNNS
jgi:flagellar hook assembly protein FlgD